VQEQWITTKEAGDLLGVTAGRVRQLVIEKRLTPIKRGRDLFLVRLEVEQLRAAMAADAKQSKRGPKFKAQQKRDA